MGRGGIQTGQEERRREGELVCQNLTIRALYFIKILNLIRFFKLYNGFNDLTHFFIIKKTNFYIYIKLILI